MPNDLIDSTRSEHAPLPDDRAGLAVFVGGLRWFGVHWGKRDVPRGLARAGFAGSCVYWDWHRPVAGLFCIPIFVNRQLAETQAHRLAAAITDWRRRNPKTPLYLLACSAGGYVAVRAMELLPDEVTVRSAAMMSAAFAADRDLSPALKHIEHRFVNAWAWNDLFILGAGTLLLGTSDGHHACGVGMRGLVDTDRYPAGQQAKLVDIPWRPAMILTGRIGGHSPATPWRFIARHIAPAMGID